jgi:peptide/nickel transport system substrate-binding protein
LSRISAGKYRRRVASTSLCALLVALIASAIGASASSATSSQAHSASSGTLVVDTSFIINTADPARDLDPTGYIVDHAIYDTLLTNNGSSTKPVPDLATSYKASPNAKVYTFNLRHGAKFSNGDPVTSADVVFSLERVINLKSAPAYLLAGIKVTAKGPYTVVLTSSTPNPAIPAIVTTPALGIVDQTAVVAHGGSDAANASKTDKAEQFLDTTSEGSGPYVLTSFSTNNQITLTANPNYWGPKPKFKSVVLRNMSAATQYLNVQRGADQIALDLSSQQADLLDRNSALQVHTAASPNVFFLQMTENAKVSPTMANPDIQEAIRYGLGYSGMIATAGTGAIQAAGIVPKQFLGSLPTSDAIKENVAKAKQLVKASGIADPSATMAFPSGINVNGLSFATLAQRVQYDLGQIGIKINLSAVPVTTFLNNYNADKYALVQSYWGPDYADPNDYLVFVPGGSVATRSDWAASADPSLATLGKKAGSTSNNTQRAALFQTIQKDLNAKSPFVNMIQPAEAIVGSSNLTGVVDNPSWILSVATVGAK